MAGTDLTAGIVVERGGKYLIVEEYVSGVAVLTQPGGHLESGESPEAAAERETLEETGCVVSARSLLGVYVWQEPRTGRQQLRIMFTGDLLDCRPHAELDEGIIAVHWLSHAELREQAPRLRSPFVLRAIADFRNGPGTDTVLDDFRPVQRNLAAIIETASPVR